MAGCGQNEGHVTGAAVTVHPPHCLGREQPLQAEIVAGFVGQPRPGQGEKSDKSALN